MPRSLLAATLALVAAAAAHAQCAHWPPASPYPVVVVPAYPLSPAVWGAPAPKPLPAIRVAPIAGGVREEADPTRPAAKPKPAGKAEPKDGEPPRIPKVRLPLPGDKLDKAVPDVPKEAGPKADATKATPRGQRVEQFVIPAEGRGEPPAEVKVGFFNHSDRDLALDVNGEPVRLPKEQYVTLRLPRTFKWAEKGAKAKDVVVPPDADGIEIVFRK